MNMDSPELQVLIKKIVAEQLVKEQLVSLDDLHDGVSRSTMIGKYWYEMISGLETVINETKDFKGMYSPTLHGTLPNTQGALIQLQMIVKMLQGIKPVVLGMDDIQRKDR
jgi:hypothetical protein